MTAALIHVLRRNLRQALFNQQLKDAEDILDRLRDEDPLALETRCFELELLVRSNRHSEAKPLAKQLISLYPDSPHIHFHAAMAAYKSKEYTLAVTHFSESLRLHPLWSTERWLAKTHTQMGEFKLAEPPLLGLLQEHPICHADLAWLYERKKDLPQALYHNDCYLQAFPENPYGEQQQLRLRAHTLAAETLIEEVETLEDLGEKVPEEMLSDYVERLLQSGQGKKARKIVAKIKPDITIKTTIDIGWKCYYNQAYDLTVDLFLVAVYALQTNPKLLNVLEYSAKTCNRLPELLEAYTEKAPQSHNFYGRATKIRNIL